MAMSPVRTGRSGSADLRSINGQPSPDQRRAVSRHGTRTGRGLGGVARVDGARGAGSFIARIQDSPERTRSHDPPDLTMVSRNVLPIPPPPRRGRATTHPAGPG